MLTLGSLCSGVGGLDRAIEAFFDARLSWVADNDPDLARVLEAHWPGVPNLADVTRVDWSMVPRVDVLSGGTPCQDLSHAGRMAGFGTGTRSNLWSAMRDAIAVLRPSIVVWENVRGALHARADSAVESDPRLLGIGGDRPALRALGRVLGDLSQLGFDAEWGGVPASDAGAPHRRWRVFVIAYDSRVRRDLRAVGKAAEAWAGPPDGGWPASAVRLLPTPTASDSKASGGSSPADVTLTDAVVRTQMGSVANPRHAWRAGDVDYGPAIARWEQVLGREAPPATVPDGVGGGHRLSARFAEWMMGWPDGWVTSPELGLSRSAQLRACGNGVVPQHALLALEALWSRVAA